MRSTDTAVVATALVAVLSFISRGIGQTPAVVALMLQALLCAYIIVSMVNAIRKGMEAPKMAVALCGADIVASLILGIMLLPVIARILLVMPRSSLCISCASGFLSIYVAWRGKWRGWFVIPIPVTLLYLLVRSGYAEWMYPDALVETVGIAVLLACIMLVARLLRVIENISA